MSDVETIVCPAEWPAWVVEGFGLLAAAEQECKDSWLPNDAPPWVWNIVGELTKMMNPTVHAETIACGPRTLGKIVGHVEWLFESENGLEKQLDKFTDALKQIDDELRRKLSRKAYARLITNGRKYQPDIDRYMNEWCRVVKAKVEAVQKVKALAEQQSFKDKREFCAGRAQASQVSPPP